MNFTKGKRLALMAALTLAVAGPGLPLSLRAGTPLSNINHIIVIYQENWTFDALYGSFPGANGLSNASTTSLTQLDRLNGTLVGGTASTTGSFSGPSLVSELPGNYTLSNPATYGTYNDPQYNNIVNTLPPKPVNESGVVDPTFEQGGVTTNALLINTLSPYALTDPALSPLSNATDNYNSFNYITGDIYHRYWQEQFQINGGNNNLFQSWSDDPGLVLSHYDATDLPEGLLAQQYTLCDNYFHSAFGGSFLNHQFLIAEQAPVYTATPSGAILSAVDPKSGILQLAGVGNNISLTNLATTSGSNVVTVASTVGLYKNMPIADSGGAIPASTTVSGITNETTFTISKNATATEASVTGTASPGIPTGDEAGQLANDSKIAPIGAPSFESYLYGDSPVITYDKHYAVNTIYSINLVPVGTADAVGTSVMPSINDSNPSGANYELNIGDLLSASNISWKWYSGGWNMAVANSPSNPSPANPSTYDATQNFQWHHQPFAYFDNYNPFGAATVPPALVSGSTTITQAQNSALHLQDENNFYTDVANNTLPSVCFIKPVGNNNEHPGYAALQVGMAHVSGLIQAVQQNPALWAHTMIIITYDEHGGRWDHVAPPHRDIWGPGVRVPALIISPYAKQGYIDHTQYDTSSILATIESRFGINSLNTRDANAPTMTNALTNTQITRGSIAYSRHTNSYSEVVTITNLDSSSLTGPVNLVLDNLNTTLTNATGTTQNNLPASPYIAVGGTIASGGSASVTLQFAAPSSNFLTYTTRVIAGTSSP